MPAPAEGTNHYYIIKAYDPNNKSHKQDQSKPEDQRSLLETTRVKLLKHIDYVSLDKYIRKLYPGDVSEILSQDYVQYKETAKRNKLVPFVYMHNDVSFLSYFF